MVQQMSEFSSILKLNNIYHILFVHSYIDGYLVCLHFLPIVNNIAANAGVYTSLQDLLSSQDW
jgi:hypothetical protein